jgi:DnaJ-class molecular chaperone
MKINIENHDGRLIAVELSTLSQIQISNNNILSADCGYCEGTGEVVYVRGEDEYTRSCPDCNSTGRLDILDLTDCLPQ